MLLQQVRSLRAALADLDPATVSVADARVVASELAKLKNACAAAEARFAARAGTSAEELARAGGTSVGAAKAALETMSALGSCPVTADALAAGELSLAQAHEITRTAKERPGTEAELLTVAKHSGLRRLKERARKRRHEAVGVDEVHRRRVSARQFRHWMNDLGNVAFCGELPPETGMPFVNRLEAEIDRVRRAAKRRTETPLETREAHAADAFVRLFHAGGGKRAPSSELVIVVDYPALLRGRVEPGELCHIIGGGDIPVEVAKTLSTDALLKIVIHDGVHPLRVKHFSRYRPAELDTVLKIGPPPDFGGLVCSTEGCERQAHLQLDHIDPIANWGPTSYDNLAPRCWDHHQAKTQQDRKAGLLDGRGRSP